jgi:hypothetical protein
MMSRTGAASPEMRANSNWAAVAPSTLASWATTVTGGVSLSDRANSSKPISATRLDWPCRTRSANASWKPA